MLTLSCPDAAGIVRAVASLLVDLDCSIESSQQYGDPQTERFFMRVQFAGGHGVYPLIGDPDGIADEIERIHAAGFAGATLAFVDYLAELPYFASEVLPRLARKGLRRL